MDRRKYIMSKSSKKGMAALVFAALAIAFMATGCGGSAEATEVAEMSSRQRKVLTEQCLSSSMDAPVPAGTEGLLAGYAPISGLEFQLGVAVEGYVSAPNFTGYLVKNYRTSELTDPRAMAFGLKCQVYDYAGDVLPYADDMFDIVPVDASGRELSSVWEGEHTFEGMAPFEVSMGEYAHSWLCVAMEQEEAIAALKVAVVDSNGAEQSMYLALPQSDASALPSELPAMTALEMGAPSGEVTALKASTGKNSYASVRGNDYTYMEDGTGVIDLVVDYSGPSVNIADVGFYAYSEAMLYDNCSVYLESEDGKTLLTEGATKESARNLIHLVINGITEQYAGDIELRFLLDGKQYAVPYTIGELAGDFRAASAGDRVSVDGVADIEIAKASYAQSIKPAKTGGKYSYYEVNDKENTYAAMEFEFTNLSSKPVEIGDVCGVSLTTGEQAEYVGFIVRQSESGRELAPGEPIEPRAAARCFTVVTVPKETQNGAAKIFLSVDATDIVLDMPTATK